jgi:hypothetical protein
VPFSGLGWREADRDNERGVFVVDDRDEAENQKIVGSQDENEGGASLCGLSSFFLIQHGTTSNWKNSNLGYATGTAASILGLSKGSAGYTSGGYTVPHSSIFLSTPGGIVTDPSTWLNNFQQTNSGVFSSCELTNTSTIQNPGLFTAVQNWGAANGTPCPSAWINNPACTPRAGYFPSTCTGAAGPNISNISSNTPSSTVRYDYMDHQHPGLDPNLVRDVFALWITTTGASAPARAARPRPAR